MNNGPTILTQEESGGYKIAVNSIQRTLFVERLYVNIAFPADRIIPYDRDNLYPNKVKSIAARSGTTSSAIGTLSAFISGEGFAGMDTVVNSEEQTLWDIIRHIADSRSMFRGFALHFNYNLLGQITEITPVNFEFVRWSKDLKRYVVNPDWARRNRRKEEIEYQPFNPDQVLAEIKQCGDISKYKGQIFYWIPNLKDYYCTCLWDSVLDDAQFEAESKLYSLSSIQNDYSLAGILSYPKNITDKGELDNIKTELKEDMGSKNAGGIRVIGAIPSENLTNWKWFTPISRNNIDSLHTNQIERAKFNIYAAFRQPPILNGVATSGMFNKESFADAFNYYNSQTETERKEVEKVLSKVLSYAVFPVKEIQIQPKKFSANKEQLTPQEIQQKSIETRETAQAALKGTVGGVDGIMAILAGLAAKTTTPESAITILVEIYGFAEETARRMIGAGALTPEGQPAGEPPEVNDTLTNLTGRQLQGVFRITRKYKKAELTYEQAASLLKDGFGFSDEQIKIWLVNDEQDI